MRKNIVSIAVAAILAMIPMSAMAATSDEIQTEIDAAEEELSQAKNDEEELLDSQGALQDEIDDLNSEIAELNDEMDELGNVTFREALSDIRLEIVHSLENIFNINSDSENKEQTIREQFEENTEQLEKLQTELETVSEEVEENADAATGLETKQADLTQQLDDLQEEYEKASAEEEAARVAAEEEAARIAAEEEAARIAAEEEAARIAAEEAAEETAAQTGEESSSSGNPPVEAATSDSYEMPSGSGILTWSGGVNYFNGHMETWYTMREWKGDLGIPGMYIGKDGIVRDCDNYICVASDDDPKGTVLETSLGTAKVYDCGPGHGIIDIYTDWPLY